MVRAEPSLDRINALVGGTPESSLPPGEDTVGSQPSVKQEAGPHQNPSLPAP